MDALLLDARALFGALAVIWILVIAVMVAVLVLSILVVVQAHKAGREGWWIYLIAVFVWPFNLVSIIYWFAHGKRNPVMSNGKPFL